MLFYPTIARKYFVKTQTYVALFGPHELSLIFYVPSVVEIFVSWGWCKIDTKFYFTNKVHWIQVVIPWPLALNFCSWGGMFSSNISFDIKSSVFTHEAENHNDKSEKWKNYTQENRRYYLASWKAQTLGSVTAITFSGTFSVVGSGHSTSKYFQEWNL